MHRDHSELEESVTCFVIKQLHMINIYRGVVGGERNQVKHFGPPVVVPEIGPKLGEAIKNE